MRTQHTPDASTNAQVEEIFIRWEKTTAKDAIMMSASGTIRLKRLKQQTWFCSDSRENRRIFDLRNSS